MSNFVNRWLDLKFFSVLSVLIFAVLLNGCAAQKTSAEKNVTEQDRRLVSADPLPAEPAPLPLADLLPPLQPVQEEERFDVIANAVSADVFFKIFWWIRGI